MSEIGRNVRVLPSKVDELSFKINDALQGALNFLTQQWNKDDKHDQKALVLRLNIV